MLSAHRQDKYPGLRSEFYIISDCGLHLACQSLTMMIGVLPCSPSLLLLFTLPRSHQFIRSSRSRGRPTGCKATRCDHGSRQGDTPMLCRWHLSDIVRIRCAMLTSVLPLPGRSAQGHRERSRHGQLSYLACVRGKRCPGLTERLGLRRRARVTPSGRSSWLRLTVWYPLFLSACYAVSDNDVVAYLPMSFLCGVRD